MRSAIFVDAGYLYAQGSKALPGDNLRRADVELDLSEVIDRLLDASDAKTGDALLLRIYWYDGLLGRELSQEQRQIANTDDVKLRLGIVNPAGRQKGVDSLIVTDLVELARNQAITDAVLLSGDEDLRIGVQIAQSFGVRVHLIGIEPSRGSQSLTLLQEADTTTEWSKSDVCNFMTLKPGFKGRVQASSDSGSPEVGSSIAATLQLVIDDFITRLSQREIEGIDSLGEAESIPREFDSRLLAACRAGLNRDLNVTERVHMRTQFREKVRERAEDLQSSQWLDGN